MKKLRELALKSILEAQSWLDKEKDERALNYLRLAREQLEVDDVYEEAESLGISTTWSKDGRIARISVAFIRRLIEDKKKKLAEGAPP
jgi:hypothetical protein